MRIIVDLDGTFSDFSWKKVLGLDVPEPTCYNPCDFYGLSRETINQYIYKAFKYNPQWFTPKPEAVEVLQTAYDDGADIYFYTNRLDFVNKIDVESWLITHGVPFVAVTNKIVELPIVADVAIDDNPTKLLELEGIAEKLLLFDAPWNFSMNLGGRLIRVYGWNDIGRIVGEELDEWADGAIKELFNGQ